MKIQTNSICGLAVMILMTICSSGEMTAQEYSNTPVEISKEKIRIGGDICYSHIVQERQTLYSISKAYEVSVEDIYRYNPTLKETGLKKNSIIIIPSKEALEEKKPKISSTTQEEAVVQEETKAQAVSTSAKEKAEVVEQQPPVKEMHKQQKKSKRIHIAKWYEDLDVIADHYGVTVEQIMQANNLKGRKLARRQKLIIPYPGESVTGTQEEYKEEQDAEVQTEMQIADTTRAVDTLTQIVFKPQEKVNTTIILPMTNAEGEPNRNNIDFYCGALLAVYDMSEKGIDCNLTVYDIMDSSSSLNPETLENSDVIIGPVSSAELTRLFNKAPEIKTVISPLDPRAEKLTDSHPVLLHAPTPHMVQYLDLVKWMEEDLRSGDKVMMISEKGARQSGMSAQVKEAMDSSALAYTPFSYSILEGRDITEPLTELMTKEGKNRVIIASESEAFVNDVVRNLNLLIYNNLDIVLYAPSKIRGFDTIEVENLHNTSMHVSLGYYIDYEADEVKNFLLKYRALYKTEPTQFAFQGYDLTKYFMELISNYGKKWKEKLPESEKEMLQSTYMFTKKPSGGYINNGVRRIIYDKGYQVNKVK